MILVKRRQKILHYINQVDQIVSMKRTVHLRRKKDHLKIKDQKDHQKIQQIDHQEEQVSHYQKNQEKDIILSQRMVRLDQVIKHQQVLLKQRVHN